MSMKKYKLEEIVTLLRKVEVEIANGETTPSLQGGPDHRTDLLPLGEGIRRFEAGPGEATERTGTGERQTEAVRCGTIAG
jgi:hypothetical protein